MWGGGPHKLGKDNNEKLTCLGKNIDKTQGLPPNLEAFVTKTTHKSKGRIKIFCNFMRFCNMTVMFYIKPILGQK